jgi:hypothetical protein
MKNMNYVSIKNFFLSYANYNLFLSYVWALCYMPGGRGFEFPMRSLDFSIDLILPVALWP